MFKKSKFASCQYLVTVFKTNLSIQTHFDFITNIKNCILSELLLFDLACFGLGDPLASCLRVAFFVIIIAENILYFIS